MAPDDQLELQRLRAENERLLAALTTEGGPRRSDVGARDLRRAIRSLTAIAGSLVQAQAQAASAAPPEEVAGLRHELHRQALQLEQVEQEVRALLSSRRWRIGNRLGGLVNRLTPGGSTELAADRLLRHFDSKVVSATAIEVAPSGPQPLHGWPTPAEHRHDVVMLANVGWGTRVQRPQHLALTFGAHNHRVFYVTGSEWLDEDHPLGYELRHVAHNVWEVVLSAPHDPDRYHQVAGPELVDRWMDALDQMRADLDLAHVALHVHLQSWTPLALRLREEHGWRLIYDCMDEWHGFPGMGGALVRAERELVEAADLVSVTAEALLAKWLPVNPRCVLVRNAVDLQWFTETARPSPLLHELNRPVIGFFGALAAWVDFELLAKVATARPEWSFVLVGDSFVDDVADIDTLPNVTLTGLRPFEEIPLWLFTFDVAIIPFKVDHISAAVDPVKFYEYVTLGTPVVATPLPELEEHREHLYVADDAASFEAAIESALTEEPTRRAPRSAIARANSWTERYRVLDASTQQLWPQVSVIVVTFGRLDLTRACVESLLAKTAYPRWELIVVDNASPDGTPAYLRHLATTHRNVRVILNDENRGFAAANNQGLNIATGDVLILLNNDTVVPSRWMLPLLDHLEDPSVGLVGPRSDNVGNEARIEVPPNLDIDEFARELRERRAGQSFQMQMVAMFCVAMRREVFHRVGPLDEGYGIGLFEDDDYGARMREAGLRVVCAQDAFVHHVGQGTFASLVDTGEYDELWEINKARFEARWGEWAQRGSVEPRP